MTDLDQIEAALDEIAWYVACASPGEPEPRIVRKVKDARLALARLRAQPQPTATAVPAETATDETPKIKGMLVCKKCEGCGLISKNEKYTKVHLTNGALTLCQQCLDEFNAKNPELASLRSELSSLREQNERLRQCLREACGKCRECGGTGKSWRWSYGRHQEISCPSCSSWRSALAEAGDSK